MSSSADLVIKNTVWRIESTDPSHGYLGRGFCWMDPASGDPERAPLPRTFVVRWLGQQVQEGGVEDAVERVADHSLVVEVYYPDEYPLDLLQEIMLQDRHDLIKALRDDRNKVGYCTASPTEDIGLWGRRVVRAEVSDDYELTATLRLELECVIAEEE